MKGKSQTSLKNAWGRLIPFLRSPEFSKALLVGIAVSLPVFGGIFSGYPEIGIAIAFGAFWCSPGFVIGNFPDNLRNLLIAAAIITLVTLTVGFLKESLWLTFPGLFVLSFFLSYISLYGQRAALISLSGLLALVLGFAFSPKVLTVYEFAFFTGVGGVWYLALTILWNKFSRRDPVQELLEETLQKSARFLKSRGQILRDGDSSSDSIHDMIQLQADLAELHESLRDHILRKYRDSGRSVTRDRRVLLLIELVDLLETAMAHPLDLEKLPWENELVVGRRKMFGEALISLSENLEKGWPHTEVPPQSPVHAQSLEPMLEEGREEFPLEIYLFFRNQLHYLKAQESTIRKIQWLFSGKDSEHFKVPPRESLLKFIPRLEYDPNLLWRNLNFGSSIFRHSLRLSIALTVGYAIGVFFNFQNPYWIMLTVIVILRPSYGMTRQRFRERLIGTLIGGALGLVIALMVENVYVLGLLGIFSIVLAFANLQKNYRVAATFITTGVVFIYAVLRPDVWNVVQYRFLDTLIGAVLSIAAAAYLFPVWEFLEIDRCMKASIEAKRKFLEEIRSYYEHKGKLPGSYKLARRDAFLANSRLRAAFMRMAQDPPSKQKDLDKVNEWVVLDHSFLTALSSLGSHIRHRPTTAPSDEFNTIIDKIKGMLDTLVEQLDGIPGAKMCPPPDKGWKELQELAKAKEVRKEKNTGDHWKVQEAYLVLEQLRWLQNLGQQMCNLLGKMGLPGVKSTK